MTDQANTSVLRLKSPGNIGIATLIIAAFWFTTLIGAYFTGISVQTLLSDTMKRAGMNGILVLAMVPAIQSGTGPNFALPVGIVCGLFALICAIEFNLTGALCLFVSIILSIPIAVIAGYAYGKLLNAVKGSEMTIATYTGFSITALMCLVWMMVPFTNEKIGWFLGEGLRETIQLGAVDAAFIINNFMAFKIGEIIIPTGLLLIFGFFSVLVWLFFDSKSGIAISAGGINPKFAQATGLNIDRNRILANILSTVLGAIGIIVYSQSFGYAQLYTAPLMMAFPAVAAVLIGGATASRANVLNVIIGVFLFQGLLTTALPVANEIFKGTDLSEVMRMIIQNGIILYALTQVKRGG
ncbi:MAG: ABC transporter permease [Synergistaceae bacterium]|nr:ABC transporter permease [Synergistaceae bacterium]